MEKRPRWITTEISGGRMWLCLSVPCSYMGVPDDELLSAVLLLYDKILTGGGRFSAAGFYRFEYRE
jgi:hypothetical protein